MADTDSISTRGHFLRIPVANDKITRVPASGHEIMIGIRNILFIEQFFMLVSKAVNLVDQGEVLDLYGLSFFGDQGKMAGLESRYVLTAQRTSGGLLQFFGETRNADVAVEAENGSSCWLRILHPCHCRCSQSELFNMVKLFCAALLLYCQEGS